MTYNLGTIKYSFQLHNSMTFSKVTELQNNSHVSEHFHHPNKVRMPTMCTYVNGTGELRMLIRWPEHRNIILDYPGELNVIMSLSTEEGSERENRRESSVRSCHMTCWLWKWRNEARSHERYVAPARGKRQRNEFEFSSKHTALNFSIHLNFSPVRLILHFWTP